MGDQGVRTKAFSLLKSENEQVIIYDRLTTVFTHSAFLFCWSGEFDDYKNNVVTTPEAQTEENHHNMELLLVAIEDFKNFL